MSNSESEYWRERFEQLEQSLNQEGMECYEQIEKQYRQAQKQIENELSKWYYRLAKNNNISMQEARKLLTSDELKEFKWTVEDYIDFGKENAINNLWMKELENASAKYHISRLEAIKIQTQQQLEVMFGNQLDSIDLTMRDVYTKGYYHTAFEIQKGVGVGWNFSTLDERKISKVINNPWAADGKNFSQRIWGNRQKLINELNTELTKNIILGQDPQKAIDAIAKKMNVSKNNAGALVMTEQAFFSSAAQKDCFNELDVEEFEVVATLDSHTTEICRKMDGKHFPMSQWEVGTTAPPFHVRCRSTTIPYFDDDFGVVGKRAARDEEGKTYYVPANMTYKEWEKTLVDKKEEAKDRFGLITNNNKSDPRYYDFKGKDIRTIEKEIGSKSYEVGVIFDKNGIAQYCQLGNEDTIEFTMYQLSKMKGKDVTHNHPLSTPPSPEDLYLLAKYKGKSFRTTGKNGTYVLEYSEEIEKLPEFTVFSEEYDKFVSELAPQYAKKVEEGLIEPEVALIALGEAIWKELYKKYGVLPRFERR